MLHDPELESVRSTIVNKIMIHLRHDLGFVPERLIADLDPWDREAAHIAFKIQFFLTQREEEPETIDTLKHPKTPKDAAKEYLFSILPRWIGAIARKRFGVQYTYTPVVLRKYNNCPHIITQDYQSHLAHLEGNLYGEDRATDYRRQASSKTDSLTGRVDLSAM